MSVFDGVGTSSVDEMQAAAARSGCVGPLPKLFMTSGVRDVPQPYHGTCNATDWGNNADQWAGSPEMDSFSRWLAEHYGPFSLEIIHVYQDGTTEEWKLGVKQPTGWYGWDTLNGHRGHVHWAITLEGLAAQPSPGFSFQRIAEDKDPLMAMPIIDTNERLLMTHPDIRSAQGLLAARGQLIIPGNTDRTVLMAATNHFKSVANLPTDGIIDAPTWKALAHPPGSNAT